MNVQLTLEVLDSQLGVVVLLNVCNVYGIKRVHKHDFLYIWLSLILLGFPVDPLPWWRDRLWHGNPADLEAEGGVP